MEDIDLKFRQAIINGQVGLVKYYGNTGKCIICKDNNHPLELAVQRGVVEIVEYLVNKGAKITDPIIEMATEAGYEKIIDFLEKVKAERDASVPDIDEGYKKWSEDEIQTLAALYGETSIDDISEKLGRTPLAIKFMIHTMRSKNPDLFPLQRQCKKWTRDELQIIKTLYEQVSIPEIAKQLNRPVRTLYNKIRAIRKQCPGALPKEKAIRADRSYKNRAKQMVDEIFGNTSK